MRKPGAGPLTVAAPPPSLGSTFEHADRHAGAGEVAGDDRAVMSSTDHDRVVPLVSHRRSLSWRRP